MARQTYEEVLRFLVQAEGTPELTKLARAVLSVGDAGEESEQRLAGLLDELSSAASLEKTSSEFKRLGSELIDLNGRYNTARESVKKIAEAMDSVEQPTRKQQQEFSRARRELESLGQALSQTKAEWSQQKTVLDAAGVSTRNYAQASADIVVKQREAAAAIRQFASESLEARNATASLAQYNERTAAALQKHRDRLAGTGSEARKFGASARSAASDTDRLGQSAERSSGRFGGLKSALAGLGAYLGFREAASGVGSLYTLASGAESLKKSLGNLYGSVDRGNDVYKELEEFSKKNGVAFSNVARVAIKLKAAGLDPLNGSMQALVDQNAAVGGSQEELEGKGRALSQMWAKQRIQMEEVLQLNERGVPVFELLSKVTGKQGLELTKFIENGKAGREVIKAFYEEIGRQNAGAAAGNLETLSGKLVQVKAKWNEFWRAVADNGVTTYFKAQMQSLLDSTGGMEGLAKRVSDSIIGALTALRNLGEQLAPLGKMVAGVTLGLAKHAEAVVFVGKAYATLQLARIAQGFLSVETRVRATSAAMAASNASAATTAGTVGRLGAVIGAIPKLAVLSFATIGLDLAIKGAIALNDAMEERREADRANAVADAAYRSSQEQMLRLGRQLQEVYKTYAATQIQSGTQIAAMNAAQAEQYRFNLTQAQQYFRGAKLEAQQMGTEVEKAAAREKFDAMRKAIEDVDAQLAKLGETAKGTKLDQVVDGFVEKFDELARSGKTAAEAISGAFNGIELKDVDGLKAVDDMITQISARGREAGEAVRTELRAQLMKLSAEDLKSVQSSIESAFGAGTEKAKLFGAELGKVNAAKLGVDLDAVLTGFTSKGKDAIAAIGNIRASLEQMGATADQKAQAMATAFDNAFKQITTKGELVELKKQLEASFKAGELSVDAFNDRVKIADGALQEMSKSGAKVGLTVAEAAAKAGESLKNLANDTANVNKQMTNSGAAVAAVIKGVKDASDNEREAAERAKAGAESVDTALQQTSQTAATMKEQLAAAADAYSNLGLTTRRVSPEIAEQLQKVKLAFVGSTSGGVDNILVQGVNAITQMVEAQGKAVDAQVAKMQSQLAKLEPINKDLERLKRQYNTLDASELQPLADLQAQLRKARSDRRAAVAPVASNEAITSAPPADKLIIEFKGSGLELANMTGVAKAKFLDELSEGILQRINRSRSNSNRPRAGR